MKSDGAKMKRYMEITFAAAILIHFCSLRLWSQSVPFDGENFKGRITFSTDCKWLPVDISEADKFSSLSTYYFGHNPANRIELSRGRDLVLGPGSVSGPINFLAYPVLEIGGKPETMKVEFSFKRKTPRTL